MALSFFYTIMRGGYINTFRFFPGVVKGPSWYPRHSPALIFLHAGEHKKERRLRECVKVASPFEAEKKEALERLERRGADDEVMPILKRLNALDDFFTTSSCSGRIVVICLPEIGAKREAVFVGKWHRPVRKEEVIAAIAEAPASTDAELWFIVQSPILHVACRTVDKAAALLRLALDAGFKYSGMKGTAATTGRVVVELMSTERMDVPLAAAGTIFYTEQYLEFIVQTANVMLTRGKAKLERFFESLSALD
jgi:tRNA wybutosine-synthesizing protein 3